MDRLDKNTDNKGPDMDGLREFVLRSDRGTPLHFVGREAEIRRLGRVLEATLQAYKTGDGSQKGNTQLITAAPGAGKSALLEELKENWEAKGVARVVQLHVSTLADRTATYREFVSQLNPVAAEQFGVTTTESKTAGIGYVFVLTSQTGEQRTQQLPLTANAVVRWLKSEERSENGDVPIVLLVDEVQNLRLENQENAAGTGSLLRDVHEGVKGTPIMLVLAGLGDSIEVLEEWGISRLEGKSRITLGGLSLKDMREATEKFFGFFHVRGSLAERAIWAEAIAEETSGWPQHLVNGLCGAAEAIVEGHGDLAQSSLEAALAHGSAHRRNYYIERNQQFQRMPELLSAVFAAMPQGAGTEGVFLRRAISRAYKETPDLADEMDRSEVFTKLLHKGLIQDFGDDRYDCPIPSMRTYVEEFCAQRGCPIVPAVAEAVVPAAAAAPPVPEPSGGMGD